MAPPGPDSWEARSAAVEYARAALGLGGGGGHGGGHALEDGPGEEKVFLCGAMSQIVNGVNYRLTLGTGKDPAKCETTTTAQVYKSFDDVFEVKAENETSV